MNFPVGRFESKKSEVENYVVAAADNLFEADASLGKLGEKNEIKKLLLFEQLSDLLMNN